MFDNLPEDLNRKIMSYFFRGYQCTFCGVFFRNGHYDPSGSEHCCEDCASYFMYERGSLCFFESKKYIKF